MTGLDRIPVIDVPIYMHGFQWYNCSMKVVFTLPLAEGLALIKTPGRISHNGHEFAGPSGRELFLAHQHKLTCTACGLKANQWRLDYYEAGKGKNQQEGRVLNLYGDRGYGSPVLFTQDHILPASLGGTNRVENLRVMCQPCNGKRGNEMTLFEMVQTLDQPHLALNTRESTEYKNFRAALERTKLKGYRLLKVLVAMAADKFKKLGVGLMLAKRISKKALKKLKRQEKAVKQLQQLTLFNLLKCTYRPQLTAEYSWFSKNIDRLRVSGMGTLSIFKLMAVEAEELCNA